MAFFNHDTPRQGPAVRSLSQRRVSEPGRSRTIAASLLRFLGAPLRRTSLGADGAERISQGTEFAPCRFAQQKELLMTASQIFRPAAHGGIRS